MIKKKKNPIKNRVLSLIKIVLVVNISELPFLSFMYLIVNAIFIPFSLHSQMLESHWEKMQQVRKQTEHKQDRTEVLIFLIYYRLFISCFPQASSSPYG